VVAALLQLLLLPWRLQLQLEGCPKWVLRVWQEQA
jgi:hypothetical protein